LRLVAGPVRHGLELATFAPPAGGVAAGRGVHRPRFYPVAADDGGWVCLGAPRLVAGPVWIVPSGGGGAGPAASAVPVGGPGCLRRQVLPPVDPGLVFRVAAVPHWCRPPQDLATDPS